MTGTGFFWILLACALFGLLHSVLASLTVKAAAARLMGETAYQRFYRLFFSLAGGLTTLLLLALAAWLPDRLIYTIPLPWRYLTLLLQAASVLTLLYAVMQTGALRFIGIQQVVEGSPSAAEKLVVNGLYRRVRHPIYTASFVLLWLVPVMTWNILALNLGLSIYMVIGSIFEERKLVEQFGTAYENYRRHTGRLLPGRK